MRKRGLIGAEVEIRVPFFDVDSINVVWHGHYVKYLEQARCELLDMLGYNYDAMRASGYAWPVIDLHLRYAQPAQFGQRLTVRAELVEWEHRLKINYLILDAESGRRLTRATSEQVAVCMRTREMQLASPAELRDAVQRRLQSMEAPV
ncbi:thioesterase [Achromobacter sp. RTa]|uniref:acyl-CoA thioesterase n=1 Tax=Achromobacter sp. RTa TaxID=1532557 RepID=UPI00050E52FB|nr:acyl-CoA thioesterase [Achromobacter sp. RTa]KGD92197.1 thioesterase [Achromobacter sp. RTa]